DLVDRQHDFGDFRLQIADLQTADLKICRFNLPSIQNLPSTICTSIILSPMAKPTFYTKPT
ncbi:MAG TPA: hypothetical protein VII75_15600, partial [Thermoanaerobaculia bacterium]